MKIDNDSFQAPETGRPCARSDGLPTVALIATVYNCRDELKQSLSGFVSERNVALVDEIVISDGGSTDGTWELLQQHADAIPKFRPVREKGANICRGRNMAIQASTGEILVLFDSGTTYCEGWLDQMLKPFREDAGIDVVEGITEPVGSGTFQEALCHLGGVGANLHSQLPQGASHRCIAYRRRVWEQVGGYPEHVRAGEDTWFNARLRKLGMSIRFVPEARCYWDVRGDFRSLWRMQYRNTRGHVELRGNWGTGRIYAIASVYLVVATLAVCGIWHPVAWVFGAGLYLAYLGHRLLRKGRRGHFLNPLHFAMGTAILACLDCALVLACLNYARSRLASARENRLE